MSGVNYYFLPDDKTLPFALRGRDRHAVALVKFAKERNLYDPVADGLHSAFEYDKTYFDKLTASLLPLLEKLTSGKTGELLAPDYQDMRDPRPILDWMRVIREQGIVYVGLDALADPEVAGAVGNSMFVDLTSIAGQLYKHGDTLGLPEIAGHRRGRIAIHADEFNELIGDEFIPLLNKAGSAGVQVTAYTQTASDIEAGIGDRAKAGQVSGNLNTLIMLRVKNEETAAILTDQLPKVRVYTKVAESRITDNNDPDTPVDFIAQNADRLTEVETEMLTDTGTMLSRVTCTVTVVSWPAASRASRVKVFGPSARMAGTLKLLSGLRVTDWPSNVRVTSSLTLPVMVRDAWLVKLLSAGVVTVITGGTVSLVTVRLQRSIVRKTAMTTSRHLRSLMLPSSQDKQKIHDDSY